jgi:hypothetical protein
MFSAKSTTISSLPYMNCITRINSYIAENKKYIILKKQEIYSMS